MNLVESNVGINRALAQRRGILMSLSRDRQLILQPRLFQTILFALISLGIGPLFHFLNRIDRWRRFEMLELSTFARELLEMDPREDTRALVRLADDESIRNYSRLSIRLMLLISIGLAIRWVISLRSLSDLPQFFWQVDSIDMGFSMLMVVLMAVAIGLLWMLLQHEKSVDRFYKSLDAWLLSRERRPLEIKRTRSSVPGMFILVSVLWLIVGFAWITPSCLVAAAMTRHAIRVSSMRRPLIRELLIKLSDDPAK